MTESELLRLKIEELKQRQAMAWRRIADPQLTPFEHREVRNHIKESGSALRRCLTIMSKRNTPARSTYTPHYSAPTMRVSPSYRSAPSVRTYARISGLEGA